MKLRILLAAVSFGVGVWLCFYAAVLGGAGHGTYIPLGLCASPSILISLSLRHSGVGFFLGLGLAPFVWAWMALLATSKSARSLNLLAALLCTQYLGALLCYWHFEETPGTLLKIISEIPQVGALFGAFYLAAHILFWRQVLSRERAEAACA